MTSGSPTTPLSTLPPRRPNSHPRLHPERLETASSLDGPEPPGIYLRLPAIAGENLEAIGGRLIIRSGPGRARTRTARSRKPAQRPFSTTAIPTPSAARWKRASTPSPDDYGITVIRPPGRGLARARRTAHRRGRPTGSTPVLPGLGEAAEAAGRAAAQAACTPRRMSRACRCPTSPIGKSQSTARGSSRPGKRPARGCDVS